jgi:uncharacterized cupin superfamily protein
LAKAIQAGPGPQGARLRIRRNRDLPQRNVGPTDHPEWIEEGEPKARAFYAVGSADGTIQSGEWDCTAGRFRWTYFEDEVIRILEGQALIEVEGEFRPIGPGDMIFFPLGKTVRWNVPKYVRKMFFIRHPGKVVEVMRSFKILGAFLASTLSEWAISEPLLLALA